MMGREGRVPSRHQTGGPYRPASPQLYPPTWMSDETRNRLYVREGLLLLGFALLLAASAVSVLVPELAKDPQTDEATRSDADAGSTR
jgi:hypothetical protein